MSREISYALILSVNSSVKYWIFLLWSIVSLLPIHEIVKNYVCGDFEVCLADNVSLKMVGKGNIRIRYQKDMSSCYIA